MMATNVRKDKRLKERLRTGDKAVGQLVRLQAQVATGAAEIDRLQSIDVAYNDVKRELSTCLRDLSATTEQLVEVEERIHELIKDRSELRHTCSQQTVAIEHLQKQNTKLKADDKDAAKLRRRLQTTKEELQTRNSEISQLKKKATGF